MRDAPQQGTSSRSPSMKALTVAPLLVLNTGRYSSNSSRVSRLSVRPLSVRPLSVRPLSVRRLSPRHDPRCPMVNFSTPLWGKRVLLRGCVTKGQMSQYPQKDTANLDCNILDCFSIIYPGRTKEQQNCSV